MSICQQQLSDGICGTPNCNKIHDFLICEPCGVICPTEYSHLTHLNGKFHKRQIAGTTYPDGVKLRKCYLCDRNIAEISWGTHIRGKPHRRHLRLVQIQHALREAESNKHGIDVEPEGEGDFGVVDAVSTAQGRKVFTLKNTVANSRIVLDKCRLSSQIDGKRAHGYHLEAPENELLRPGQSISVVVRFSKREHGRHEDRLEFHFTDSKLDRKFAIIRPLVANVTNQADYEAMRPMAPYQKKQFTRRNAEAPTDVWPGIAPEALAKIKWVVSLAEYKIPSYMSRLLSGNSEKDIIENLKRSSLPPQFKSETYSRQWQTLLWVEEYRSEIDLQRYDMFGETLSSRPGGKFYFLKVPGLAEKRPSVIIGDRILVRRTGANSSDKWFEGYVHVVQLTEVGLRFHNQFHQYSGQRYDVRFKLGRIPLRRMHQALETVYNPERILFPSATHVVGLRVPSEKDQNTLRLYNKSIGSNPPQLRVVASIVGLTPKCPPFIVFGPPGTGKTVTIVEAILQLLLHDPSVKILACAPSNSAADLIAERLSRVLSTKHLFRLNAPSRHASMLPVGLTNWSKKNDQEIFNVPDREELKKFRVIVSTLVSSSVPYGIGIPPGHFSHIFIDEAGQAMEPELIIPVKTLADESTRVILSGDPKQLGPIVRSSIARHFGLGKSYMDRLMEIDIYEPRRNDGLTVVKLTKNWRSHEAILRFPNDRFYGGELEPCGDKVVINSFLQSSILARQGFPIVFHSMSGKDEREASSPSFFNRMEAALVKQYVTDLMSDRRIRIANEDIGVISPYNAQCQKIRSLLKPTAPGIKVGSVEEFQGQERRVIIISTVRSSLEFVGFDLKHALGFVANPRRFNVGVTRAKALLIVIGDPEILGQDSLWRSFLNYIHIHGGWKGAKMSWNPNEAVREGGYSAEVAQAAEEEMTALMYRLHGLGLEEDVGDEMEANVDKPWREED